MGYGRRSAFSDFVQGLSAGYGLGDKMRQRAEQQEAGQAWKDAYGDNANANTDAAIAYGNAAQEDGLSPEQQAEYINAAQNALVQGERTPEQRYHAGLSALEQYYGKTGNTDKMMGIGLQRRQMRSMDKQDQASDLSIAAAQRAAARDKRTDAFDQYLSTIPSMSDNDVLQIGTRLATNGVQDGVKFDITPDGKAVLVSGEHGVTPIQIPRNPDGTLNRQAWVQGVLQYRDAGSFQKAVEMANSAREKQTDRELRVAEHNDLMRYRDRALRLSERGQDRADRSIDDAEARQRNLNENQARWFDATLAEQAAALTLKQNPKDKEAQAVFNEARNARIALERNQIMLGGRAPQAEREVREPKFINVPDKNGNPVPHIWDGQQLVPAAVAGAADAAMPPPADGWVPPSQRGVLRPEDAGEFSKADYGRLHEALLRQRRGLGYNSRLFGNPSNPDLQQQQALDEQIARIVGLQRLAR